MGGKTFDIPFCSLVCVPPPPVTNVTNFLLYWLERKISGAVGCLVISGRAGDLTRIVTFLIGRRKDGMNKFVEGGREGRPRGDR